MSAGVGRQRSPLYSSPQGERVPKLVMSVVEVNPHPVLPVGGGRVGKDRGSKRTPLYPE